MKEFIIFVCTGSTEIFFSKLRSSCSNYSNLILCQHNVDTMNICMKEFIFLVELRQLFPYMAFVYAWMVPLWANQLLPQLLMEHFDTLQIQCRHIEHMHEGVYNFCLHRFY